MHVSFVGGFVVDSPELLHIEGDCVQAVALLRLEIHKILDVLSCQLVYGQFTIAQEALEGAGCGFVICRRTVLSQAGQFTYYIIGINKEAAHVVSHFIGTDYIGGSVIFPLLCK